MRRFPYEIASRSSTIEDCIHSRRISQYALKAVDLEKPSTSTIVDKCSSPATMPTLASTAFSYTHLLGIWECSSKNYLENQMYRSLRNIWKVGRGTRMFQGGEHSGISNLGCTTPLADNNRNIRPLCMV